MPLNAWFYLMYLLGCLHTSIPAASKELGLSYGVVYRASRRVVKAVGKMNRKLSGLVEVDEAYVKAGLKDEGNRLRIKLLGRGPRRRGLKGRRGRGTWSSDKIPILIVVERGGSEHYTPSISVNEEAIAKIAIRHIERGSNVYTDKSPSYNITSKLGFNHEAVNHSNGEYARGGIHINNCERS